MKVNVRHFIFDKEMGKSDTLWCFERFGDLGRIIFAISY